jgi:hypothetical protein
LVLTSGAREMTARRASSSGDLELQSGFAPHLRHEIRAVARTAALQSPQAAYVRDVVTFQF